MNFPNEQLLVLSEVAASKGPNGLEGSSLERQLVEAALRGEETLVEIHRRLLGSSPADEVPTELEAFAEQIRTECAVVRVLPFPSGFYYGWVVLQLTESEPTGDLMRGAMELVAPTTRGLWITPRETADLPDHVELYSGDPGASEAENRLALIQAARVILATMPATRVLVTDGYGGPCLGDALAAHSIGAIVEPSREEDSFSSARAAVESPVWGDRLRRLALDGEQAPEGAWPARPRTLLVEERASELREANPTSAVVRLTAGSVASFLTPNWIRSLLPPAFGAAGEQEPLELRTQVVRRAAPEAGGRRVAFASLHLLGDTLAATAILRAHHQAYPEDHVSFLVPSSGYSQIFEMCPAVDRLALVKVPTDEGIVYHDSRSLVEELPWWKEEGFDVRHILNIQEAARAPRADELHMCEVYAQQIGIELSDRRPWLDRELAEKHRPAEAPGEPYLVFARHSVSGKFQAHYDKNAKLWAERNWNRLADRVRKELGIRVVAIGTPSEARLENPGVLELHDLEIRQVAGLLTGAQALVAVDNGIYHMGLGLDVPLVHLQPKHLSSGWTASPDSPNAIDIRCSLRSLGVERVFREVRRVLEMVS